jgi:hypothetical protein
MPNTATDDAYTYNKSHSARPFPSATAQIETYASDPPYPVYDFGPNYSTYEPDSLDYPLIYSTLPYMTHPSGSLFLNENGHLIIYRVVLLIAIPLIIIIIMVIIIIVLVLQNNYYNNDTL